MNESVSDKMSKMVVILRKIEVIANNATCYAEVNNCNSEFQYIEDLVNEALNEAML